MVDWERAVERNREALLRIVEALFVMAGLTENVILGLDPRTPILPRHAYNRLRRILRPAESAARRLVFIAARGMKVTLCPAVEHRERQRRSVILGLDPRTRSGDSADPSEMKKKASSSNDGAEFRLHGVGPRVRPEDDARCMTSRLTADTVPSLPLLDPLKDFSPRRRYAKSFPRITCIGVSTPPPIPDNWIPAADDELDIRPLRRRLVALKRALGDLDGHARRLARWKARRDAGMLRAPRWSPMRIGHPPGHRRRPLHEVDDILRECHGLALYARKLDTS